MDILAHSLWTNIMYKAIPQTRNNRKIAGWGILFGILPDLISFAPLFIFSLYKGIFQDQAFTFGPPDSGTALFDYAVNSYNYTHSLVIWVAMLALAWLVFRRFPWVLLGWALHICIDIFSHTEAFFATPLLFPISGFKISAVSWSHPVFMLINYSLLLIIYLFVIPKLKSKFSNN